jgi:hypothetical protein
MVNLEGYYGDYRPAVKPVVSQWLQSQRTTDHELSRLFAELVKTHTGQYRTPPDVAIMLPLLRQIQAETDHQRLADMTRLQLPDASEVVDPSEARSFISAVMSALASGEDPRQDEAVREHLRKQGVSEQVSIQ